ncbi:MAG TPA: PGPGW domain-containing protein [Planctomycetota bacterium]|nr:PGPGW domain-containing protein [Planctomycetota bacterium]
MLVAAGILALPLPGPGSLLIVIGVALIARESALAARATDAVELRLRRGAGWCRRFWKRAHPAVKTLLVVLGVAIVAAAGYGAWLYSTTR